MLYRGGTISQNICIYLIILGVILLATALRTRNKK